LGSGPFYCPGDATVYLDTDFFVRFVHGGQADAVAQAYIVGHEVAHHVQRLVGIAERIGAATKAHPDQKNKLTTKAELQADCLAGVWARSAYPRSSVTSSDLIKGLTAADMIGDDYDARLRGQYVTDTAEWTHGSSAQRQLWLRTGFNSGRPTACNTFGYG
jgi:predicted metalloprotease